MDSFKPFTKLTPKELEQIPFFKDLDEENIQLLAERMQLIKADAGDLIITEGSTSQKMYFIIEGTVKIYRKNSRGRIENICDLSAPNYFGEMSIIDGGPRSATVEAKSKIVLAELKWEDVRCLFDDKPEIMCYIFKNIGSTLSMRLRRVNALYSHLATL